MRPSSTYLVFLALLLLLAEAAAVHARRGRIRSGPVLEEQAAVVERLGLTDLCLFTEARTTRRPSQPDRFSPFQYQTHALEHLPSGSLEAPRR